VAGPIDQTSASAALAPDRPPASDSRAAWAPVKVLDVDVGSGLPVNPTGEAASSTYGGAWVLVRVFTEPIGVVELELSSGRLTPAELADAFPASMVEKIRARIEEAGLLWPGRVPFDGFASPQKPRFLSERDVVERTGPAVTVVVCTRNRPEGLALCLQSLQRQSYPRLSILVVDNASSSDASRRSTLASIGPFPVRYVYEPKAGLSHARNRAMAESDTDIVAWIDDDEVADEYWVSELVRGFHLTPAAGAVSGVMVPAELETQAQMWFERYGGHNKGRGFDADVFAPGAPGAQSPLLPLPGFGTGGNFAIRRSTFRRLGRFDPALGAGTRALGSEDTKAFTEILLSGESIRYQPSAITKHYHRRDNAAFSRQMYGYGVGLTAFYASLVLDRWSLVDDLVRLAPRAWRVMTDRGGPRLAGLGEEFPVEVLRLHRRGVLRGPFAYLASRRDVRRVSRFPPPIPPWAQDAN
jgi:GT2 family glycosyltransferase